MVEGTARGICGAPEKVRLHAVLDEQSAARYLSFYG